MDQCVSHAKLKPFKQYRAGGNVMWLEVTTPLLAGVPINRRRVRTIIQHKLESPATARADQKDITVGTLQAEGARLDRGRMRLISPEKPVHALLLRVAERLNEFCSEEEAQDWHAVTVLTSWPMVFEQHGSMDALFWRSINMREDVGTQFDTLYRTPVQQCFELILYKQEEEERRAKNKARGPSMSARELFEEWNTKVQFGSIAVGDRAFKLAFVEACLAVFNKLLAVPECRDLILESEVRVWFCVRVS